MADEQNPWTDSLPSARITVRPNAAGQQLRPDNPWASEVEALDTDALIEKNPGFVGQLANFARFTGHGTARGLAETFGFPTDSFNALSEYVKDHPSMAPMAAAVPVVGPMAAAGGLVQAAAGNKNPVQARGGKSDIRSGVEKMGIPTSTPDEAGIKPQDPGYTAAHWGDVLGEFGGANLPFVFGAPETLAVKGATKSVPSIVNLLKGEKPAQALIKEIGLGAAAPGTLAVLGEEIAGPDYKDKGKAIGAGLGNLRAGGLQAMYQGGRATSAWLHDFLGFGTGAERKVQRTLEQSVQDLPGARKELKKRVPVSKGADIPADIKSGDEGLIALRRTVMANDAQLAGDYQGMMEATEKAIKADARLQKPRGRQFGSPAEAQSYIALKQKEASQLIDRRVMQAAEQAERDFELAAGGVERNSADVNLAKNQLAKYTRMELLNAKDDLTVWERSLWDKVDKTMPIDAHPIYDDLATLRAEHKARPGESDDRFPSTVVDRFFKTEMGPDGKPVVSKKFGIETKLQDIIDLDSEVQQEVRKAAAQDAPDRVYMGYLKRISESLNNAKYRLEENPLFNVSWEGSVTPSPLKEAVAATKKLHDTFSRGPVGEVLGIDSAGGMDVLPGGAIKHFLSQGPAGVDSFKALMNAVGARTGAMAPVHPSADMLQMIPKYIRQDFYDSAMASGSFNRANAEKWIKNNAGPLEAFPDLKKQLQRAVDTNGQLEGVQAKAKLDRQELAKNQASLFLGGEPGKQFNAALKGPNKYAAAKKLVDLTKQDPTGRATEGLAQMALDNMLAESIVPDMANKSLQRVNGLHVMNWVERNAGLVNALDEAMPGVKKRFERIANTARYLERFHMTPQRPAPEESATGPWLRDVMARLGGADVFRRLGHGGASIQTAAIGSQAFKKIAAALTPDQASKLLREALVDKDLFQLLTANVSKQTEAEQIKKIAPYFYSIGIPIMQPVFDEPTKKPKMGANESLQSIMQTFAKYLSPVSEAHAEAGMKGEDEELAFRRKHVNPNAKVNEPFEAMTPAQSKAQAPRPNLPRAMSSAGGRGADSPTNENYQFKGTWQTGPTEDDRKFIDEWPTDSALEEFVKRFGWHALGIKNAFPRFMGSEGRKP